LEARSGAFGVAGFPLWVAVVWDLLLVVMCVVGVVVVRAVGVVLMCARWVWPVYTTHGHAGIYAEVVASLVVVVLAVVGRGSVD
jgi:hypothetical protein